LNIASFSLIAIGERISTIKQAIVCIELFCIVRNHRGKKIPIMGFEWFSKIYYVETDFSIIAYWLLEISQMANWLKKNMI
jgi:hypothetical protein